jgi:hypothetical protein
MRLGASFGTAIAAIILQAQLRAGAGQIGHVAHAYHSSFRWEAAFALLAALTYIYMCRVVQRAPAPAHTDTGEFKLQPAEVA